MKISEVSKKYDIPINTLRYYEKAGLLPHVQKNTGGIRNYTENDCRWVEFIKCMRGAGLPIAVLKKYISLFYKGDSTLMARKAILAEERQKLVEKHNAIQATIERLDYKISVYEDKIVAKEKELLGKPQNAQSKDYRS